MARAGLKTVAALVALAVLVLVPVSVLVPARIQSLEQLVSSFLKCRRFRDEARS